MIFLLPSICSTFKGVTPTQFAERWGEPDTGRASMELDASIASEINSQISEATASSRGKAEGIADKAKGAVARREQRRAKRRG